MLTFNIITLFPELFTPHFSYLPFKKALNTKAISTNLVQLRNFAIDKHGTVDDKPYSGGTGMILRVEPVYAALQSLKTSNKKKHTERIVLLSPKGKEFNQEKAKELAKAEKITLICGRYEGVDARVEDFVTDEISVGKYILSGGEVAALAIMESVTRLLPGILEKGDATTNESFENQLLEYPQYTRPEDFMGKKVPEVLLSGNHKEIEKWRKENSRSIEL